MTHGKFSEKNFSIPHRIAGLLIHDNEQNEDEPHGAQKVNENATDTDTKRKRRIFDGEEETTKWATKFAFLKAKKLSFYRNVP